MRVYRVSSNLIYTCSASGGIYNTTDGGANWTPCAGTFMPGEQMGCLAIDPSNNNSMYAGTGEPTYAEQYGWSGFGVVKSVDGGATWASQNNGMGNKVVYDLIMNKANTSELVAYCSDGIYKTTNGGLNWSKTQFSAEMQEVVLQNSTGNLFAVSDDSLFESTDWGSTWKGKNLDGNNYTSYLH